MTKCSLRMHSIAQTSAMAVHNNIPRCISRIKKLANGNKTLSGEGLAEVFMIIIEPSSAYYLCVDKQKFIQSTCCVDETAVTVIFLLEAKTVKC